MKTELDLAYLASILDEYQHRDGALIPVLQKIQHHYGYVPKETLDLIADSLRISASEIYGVITFYAQFFTQPEGKYVIRLCRGTACHVKGSKSVMEAIERKLGLKENETTSDGLFTLRIVACLGACAVAPVMMINHDYYGELTPEKVESIFDQIILNERKSQTYGEGQEETIIHQ